MQREVFDAYSQHSVPSKVAFLTYLPHLHSCHRLSVSLQQATGTERG